MQTDLQVLQWWTEEFVRAITSSLQRMPYGMRYMARETLNAVKVSPRIVEESASMDMGAAI